MKFARRFYLSRASVTNLENFISFLNTSPSRRAAIPPAGNRSHEHINMVGNRVRDDSAGIGTSAWLTSL